MHTATPPLVKNGWSRALLFFIAWVLVSVMFDFVGAYWLASLVGAQNMSQGDSLSALLTYLPGVASILLTVWLFRRLVDRQTFISIGFEWQPFKNDALIGFFTAPTLLGCGTLLLVALSYVQYTGITFKPLQLTLQVLLMLCIAFSEELMIRGYLLHNLMASFNKWGALCISAALFALLHLANPHAGILSISNIFIAGFLLGINYIYTKNLWFGILLHFAWNFFQGPVYGYEVSGIQLSSIFQQNIQGPAFITGGPFGFEGSAICTVLMLLAIALFTWHFSKKADTINNPLASA